MTDPMYVDLAADLRERIQAGEFGPGDVLPTDHELMAEHDVSRGTVRQAFAVLVNEGLVTPGRGRGGRRVRRRRQLTFYASRSESTDHRITAGVDVWQSDAKAAGLTPTQRISVSIDHVPDDVARWLEINPGTPTAVRRRLRLLDGEPDNINDTWYPMDVTEDVPEILDPTDVVQGVIALMHERGYVQVRYVDELRWRLPTPEEASQLRLAPGIAVLVQTRIGYTTDRPVKATVTVWPGDSHAAIYELPA